MKWTLPLALAQARLGWADHLGLLGGFAVQEDGPSPRASRAHPEGGKSHRRGRWEQIWRVWGWSWVEDEEGLKTWEKKLKRLVVPEVAVVVVVCCSSK